MYKIGEFSKITGASIRTLRYYDSIDLLNPIEIDLFTGYRYYSEKQVEDYKKIIDLKEIGFTLDEIKENMDNINNELLLKKKQELLKSKNYIDNQIRKLDLMRSNLKALETTKQIKKLGKEG